MCITEIFTNSLIHLHFRICELEFLSLMMYDVDAANSALLCEIIFRAEVIVFTIPYIISCNSSALFSRSLSKTIRHSQNDIYFIAKHTY